MLPHLKTPAIALLLAAILPRPAAAQTADDVRNPCTQRDPAASVANCTALIESRQEKDADLAEDYYRRGDAYFEKRQYDLAISDFSEALRLRPRYSAALNDRGLAYSHRGELDLAIADFSECLRIEPLCREGGLDSRGDAFIQQREYDRAISDFNEAIRLNPKNAGLWNDRAIAYSDKQLYKLSISDLNRAIHLRHDYADAFNTRAVQYLVTGHPRRAEKDLTRALSLDPDNAMFLSHRGQVYAVEDKNDLSMIDVNKAIAIDPQRHDPYDLRCWNQAVAGKLEQALADCNYALSKEPSEGRKQEILDSRGFIYLKSRKYDLAITDYDAALNLGKQVPTSLFGRGLAKFRIGDVCGSQADITAAKKMVKHMEKEFKKWGVDTAGTDLHRSWKHWWKH